MTFQKIRTSPYHAKGSEKNDPFRKAAYKKEDQALWNSFKAGEEAAFIHIYSAYANILYNYGCQFTSDHEIVKDCLQDFFVYLREKRSGLGNTSSIKFYLMKSFKRRVIHDLEKIKQENRNNENFNYFQFPVELSHEAIYIQNQMEEDQLLNLEQALKSLESKEREAIYYFYYEGFSYEQIADIFDFSHTSSARRLIYKGLANIRKIMMSFIVGQMIILYFNSSN
ncbi:RNA polymerase sigma factor [Cyclobacterium plantarum]|uniref:Sigma-70 family RNA polymerase sigma factor n=1 Tax=Cyclobacterium plantarum TaxID=2716263 RepID=A0ABX0HCG8_9BACT|nr:sigma-70 family RNA polymerase sigma factor [Cyclobacterium plantarum]NHE59586.1 sigma-70 family RNA polymerase sigma factor [Cyclobacterium plantarum]